MKYQKNMVLTLRAAIILAAVMAIFAAAVVVPVIGGDIAGAYPEFAYMLLPCEIFLWISAAVFLAALALAWKITSNIAAGESFSEKNARLLMYISRLALTECVWYAAGGAAMFVLGPQAALNYWRTYGGFEMLLVKADGHVVLTNGLYGQFTPNGDSYVVDYAS